MKNIDREECMIIRIYSKLMINYGAIASASWFKMMRVLPDTVFRNNMWL